MLDLGAAHLGVIRYIDHDRDLIGTQNILQSQFVVRSDYQSEEEARLLVHTYGPFGSKLVGLTGPKGYLVRVRKTKTIPSKHEFVGGYRRGTAVVLAIEPKEFIEEIVLGKRITDSLGEGVLQSLHVISRASRELLFVYAQRHGGRIAVLDSQGAFTYQDLLDASSRAATALLAGQEDLREERVAFLLAPGFPWVAAQWGIWRAGGVAVPLPLNSTKPELEYLIDDTEASTLVFDADAAPLLAPIAAARGIRVLSYEQLVALQTAELPKINSERRAMILYTSGTTSQPKGVVTTHANITAQIVSLVEAWEWSADDGILLCLPLHHVHGIINIVSCALWSGATCQMLPRFDANAVWDCIADGSINLFMAVPTVYAKLIAAWDAASPARRVELIQACARLRLMVSGSAALPVSTLQRWKEISGHTLLERYGMTEIGMALSNPLRGVRVPGSVGTPLPNVEVQLVGENSQPVPPGTPGEIEVRGPSVFSEYWGKPDATRDAFRDGWFRTGDTAVVENGRYRILGRTNVDILKTGGHKVSALEIEEALREHPAVAECAVVGVPDPEWGERVAAAVVLKEGDVLDLSSFRAWAKQFLATHKVPSRLLVLDALPRNAVGKVIKPAVAALFQTAGRDPAT